MFGLLWALLFSIGNSLTNNSVALDPVWDSTVFIRADGRDPQGHEAPSYCNAAVIAPNILITAAHCLIHAEILNSYKVQIELGSYRSKTRADGSSFLVGYVVNSRKEYLSRFVFHPKLQGKLSRMNFRSQISPDEDLAWIYLDENLDLPEDFPFAEMASTAEINSFSAKPLSFEPTIVSINYLEEISTSNTRKMARLNQISVSRSYLTSKSISRVRPGDSGAPLFAKMNGRWKLVAVVKGQASNFFSNWDVFTLIPLK